MRAGFAYGACTIVVALTAGAAPLQDYVRPDALRAPASGTASLYETPWRARPCTAAAYDALQGIGVYYKHTPESWTLADHTHVMSELAAAGVRRVRLAPHHALYLHPEWQSLSDKEWRRLNIELRACYTAGLRPCVTFVHIPPYGRPGELQTWFTRKWNRGLLPADEVGTPAYARSLDMTYEALRFVLDAARAAGFHEGGSWDLELGQGMWWGAPAIPEPPPSTDLADLQAGGRVHTFEKQLVERLRADGYREPSVWWGMTHHLFDEYRDEDLPPGVSGRAISFYAQGTAATDSYLTATQHDKPAGALDEWPARPPLRWSHAAPPSLTLARPEGWMADRSRHDNLLGLLSRSARPVAITSLGTVPKSIPGWTAGASVDGWRLKQKGVTRSLAFWLNQGAAFVLLHSAYEGKRDEESHALIPHLPEARRFRFQDAPPLAALNRFRAALEDSVPVADPMPLSWRLAVEPDPVLLPAAGDAGPLRASDLVAILPFQLDARRFAVAVYVITPDVSSPLHDLELTLVVDRPVDAVTATDPVGDRTLSVDAAVEDGSTTLRLPIADGVHWLCFTALE